MNGRSVSNVMDAKIRVYYAAATRPKGGLTGLVREIRAAGVALPGRDGALDAVRARAAELGVAKFAAAQPGRCAHCGGGMDRRGRYCSTCLNPPCAAGCGRRLGKQTPGRPDGRGFGKSGLCHGCRNAAQASAARRGLPPPPPPEPPDRDEALLARCRQLARDLDAAGGEAGPRRLAAEGASPGNALDLCRRRPQWFVALTRGGDFGGAILTDEGRAALLSPAAVHSGRRGAYG